ncbi:MerR family transcriptional regulator [Clostridium sp.]|uniref:MerR family transcriptional regulator n=1 Tax=Clostridium sp. TaxID=1506 RepID=UPI00283D5DF3|nr:MerR family transcriptional regulator [Clostridium sp.]MDR3598544.1 MerR family transcriptional regulator [Clostridium sp.]
MEKYTISQIAKLVGVNKETIRYYEKFGLLPLPERKSNGYKIYTQHHIEIMEIILIVKDSEFTLNEIKDFISIQEENEISQNDLYKEIILKKIAFIEKKIQDLHSLKKGLEKVVYDIENYNIRRCIEIKKKNKNSID